MTYSLNEIEALCKKATRGAGLPWGIAEEAGKATRWLASHDLPGPEMLSALLDFHQGNSYDNLAPVSRGEIYRSTSSSLCPLLAGAVLTDSISTVSNDIRQEFRSILFPLLLVPYVAVVAGKIGTDFELRWEDVQLIVSADGALNINGGTELLTARSPLAICQTAALASGLHPRQVIGREVEAQCWNHLNELAGRIYAPATEASRIRGAG